MILSRAFSSVRTFPPPQALTVFWAIRHFYPWLLGHGRENGGEEEWEGEGGVKGKEEDELHVHILGGCEICLRDLSMSSARSNYV